MTLHRFEAAAGIEPGQSEALIGRRQSQLVTLSLTDRGPVVDGAGREHTEPDVACHLRPSEARRLGFELISLAEHAERAGDERAR